MKRLLAYLCAVALAWAPSLNAYALSDALKAILFTPAAAAPASGTVTYDSSAIAAPVEDVANVTTATATIGSASGRYAFIACMKNDGAQTLDSASLDGTAATAIAAQYTDTWHHLRHFEIVNTSVTGASKTANCVASATSDRMGAAYIVYSGVNTTTPKNSTTTPVTGDTTTPSATVTTVTNGKALCVLSITHDDVAVSVAGGTGVTVRQQQRNVIGTLVLLERDNNGGSTVVAATITAGEIIGWEQRCYGIQP